MAQQSRSSRNIDAQAENPGSFSGFADSLRRYMSAWPVLVACLIGPLTKYFHLVPVYKDHENILAAITALYGFLLAAALFYYRPMFARSQSKRRQSRTRNNVVLMLPAVLLGLSIGSFFRYTVVVKDSIRSQRERLVELVDPAQLSAEQILARTDLTNIPNSDSLLLWYLATFLAAETSLVLMALSEYLRTPSTPATPGT